jgi:hypothetical protein
MFFEFLRLPLGAVVGLAYVVMMPMLGLLAAAALVSGKLIWIFYCMAAVSMGCAGFLFSFGWSPMTNRLGARRKRFRRTGCEKDLPE